jgi:branched-chain amino acid transport system permease protein
MPQLLKLGFFEHWTGGVQGLVVTKPDAPFGLPMSQDMWLYYFTLAIGIGIYIASVNLLRSRSGRAFMAIRDNEIAASAMGVDVALYKTLAFGVSAGITGLGAIAVQFVAPDGYTITLAISLFLGMVVGGVGWLPGSIVGSAFIIFVPNIAEGISKGLSGAVFGVLLFLVIFLVPHGARQVAMIAQQMLGKMKKN